MYGRDPSQLLAYKAGSTNKFELEQSLKERDDWLHDIKAHLVHSQQLMNNNADKHRRDLHFVVGDLVFLKLRPYRQNSVSKRLCKKLSARYYGPYRVLEKIGNAVYRLQLPADSCIHPVFHVSQLKPVLGQNHTVKPLPSELSIEDELVVEPEVILDSRYDSVGNLEILVRWKGT